MSINPGPLSLIAASLRGAIRHLVFLTFSFDNNTKDAVWNKINMKGFCVGKCVHQNLNLNPNGPELPETLKVWGEGQMAPTCNCFLLSWSLGHLRSIWTPFLDRPKRGQHTRGFFNFCPSVCLSVCPYVVHPSLSLLGLVVFYTANKPQTSDVAELGLTWQYTVDSIQ